jgi:hypothetical protein
MDDGYYDIEKRYPEYPPEWDEPQEDEIVEDQEPEEEDPWVDYAGN